MADKISIIAENVWSWPMLLAMIACGIYVSYKTGFVQIRRFFEAFKMKSGSFRASCTALAGTVGTGNIAGVALAIAYGGAGAVFWMWVSAIIGMGTKYAEIYLSVKYHGGPMAYIEKGLGKRFLSLAVLFSLFGALCSFGTGNMVQVGTACDAICGDKIIRYIAGGIMAIAALLWIAGDADRVSGVLVPVMAGVYTIGALFVIGANIENLPSAVREIFKEAFSIKALASGAAIKCGFRRGLLSNEAGLGTAPMAHGGKGDERPDKEGLTGIFEVTCDTLIICTLTAFMLLCTGNGTVTDALSGVFGKSFSGIFVAFSTCLFAISSLAAWEGYGERCVKYLLGKRTGCGYRTVFFLVAVAASNMAMEEIIGVSDILNALMLLCNLAAVVLLTGKIEKNT